MKREEFATATPSPIGAPVGNWLLAILRRVSAYLEQTPLCFRHLQNSSLFTLHYYVEVTGLEPATAWSQTRNATNCATPRSFAGAKVTKKCESAGWQP